MRRYLGDPTFSRFDTIPECDGHTHTHTHTDRQTDRHTTTAYTALSKASRGKKQSKQAGKLSTSTLNRRQIATLSESVGHGVSEVIVE